MAITNIAAVTVHYNIGVRLGARVRELAQDRGAFFGSRLSAEHATAVTMDTAGKVVIAEGMETEEQLELLAGEVLPRVAKP